MDVDRVRVAGNVAHRVRTRFARGQAHRAEQAEQRDRLRQREVMELEVLTGRDVTLDERSEALGDVRERVHLVGRDAAEWELDPHHLAVGLALAVDALLQAEADELVLALAPAEEELRALVEVVELLLEDRDDVARDVLEDLRVLARPQATALFRRLGDGCR